MFATEHDAERYVEQLLADDFRLLSQVYVRHWDGHLNKIDYIAAPKNPTLLPEGKRLIGIEVKPRYEKFRDFTAAVYQSIGYRCSTLCDRRMTWAQGTYLPFVFLFPALERPGIVEVPGSNYAERAEGVYRLAGRFNVGFIHVQLPYWGSNTLIQTEALSAPPLSVQFKMSADPFWTKRMGYGGFQWTTTRQYATDKTHGRI